jgi:hypothetical protein
MEKRPIALIINTGDAAGLSLVTEPLLKAFESYGFNKLFMQRGLRLKLPKYRGKKWARVGDGTGHLTTRYGLLETDLERQRSLGVQFRNWHPGPLGFELTSDAIALQYIGAIVHAIDRIEGYIATGHDPKQVWVEKTPLLQESDLPPFVFLDPDEVQMSFQEPPSCVNFELPTFGPAQIDVMAANDPFNDDLQLYNSSFANMKIWKASQSTLIPRAERDLPQCRHLDFCRGYRKLGDVETNPISFKLPRMAIGKVIFCGMGKLAGQRMLDDNVTAFLDGKDVSERLAVQFGKCLLVQETFQGNMSDTKGHLVLSVQFPRPAQHTITHVISE